MLKQLATTGILGIVTIGLITGLLMTVAGIDHLNGIKAFSGLVLMVGMFKVLSYLK